LVLKSLSDGRRVLLFCRTREGQPLALKAAQSVKGLSSDAVFSRYLEPGVGVGPDNTLDPAIFDSARLVIFGMEPYGGPYDKVRGDLAANILGLIADTDKSYIDDFDIYMDDAQLWGADAITALPGEATLVCQRLSQLDMLLGEERSDYLVERFREWEFFRCADKRTIDKAVDLSNFQIGLDIMLTLGTGDSFLVERSVRKTCRGTKSRPWLLTWLSRLH